MEHFITKIKNKTNNRGTFHGSNKNSTQIQLVTL